jgi:hypothetical protein
MLTLTSTYRPCAVERNCARSYTTTVSGLSTEKSPLQPKLNTEDETLQKHEQLKSVI